MSNEYEAFQLTQTGATREQLTAAAQRSWDAMTRSEQSETSGEDGQFEVMKVFAPFLIPPTERIVSVDDLKNLFSAASYNDMPDIPFTAEWTAMLGRIRALIGGE